METRVFEVRTTPKKGRGLFALRDIPKGSTVLTEKVLAIWVHEGNDSFAWTKATFWAELKNVEETPGLETYGKTGRLIRGYIEEVEAEGFHAVRELRGAHSEFQDRLVDIFFTNRLRLKNVLSYMGLGKHSSVINHACIPNAHLSGDNGDRSKFRMNVCVKATKDIATGEEITISYLELNYEQERRQIYTHAYFKFICACDICEALDPTQDVKMLRLREAYEAIDKSKNIPLSAAEPWTFFRNTASVLRLLRELDISDRRIAGLWWDCASIAVHHSDAVRARYFLRMAAAWSQVAEPADCVERDRANLWSDSPEQHQRWGQTTIGASDLAYDPIVDDDALREQTLGLLFMNDYEAPKYRRIAAGADRDLSAKARAQIETLSPYYSLKMEDDMLRIEADTQRVAFEAEQQRAKANQKALIAEIEREDQEKAVQDAKKAAQISKKVKKNTKHTRRKPHQIGVPQQPGGTAGASDAADKLEESATLTVHSTASYVAVVDPTGRIPTEGWREVTRAKRKPKGKRRKGSEEQIKGNGKNVESDLHDSRADDTEDGNETKSDDDAGDDAGDANGFDSNINIGLDVTKSDMNGSGKKEGASITKPGVDTRSASLFTIKCIGASSVEGGKEQRPFVGNGRGQASRPEPSKSTTEEKQASTDEGTQIADLRFTGSVEAEDTDQVDRFGERAAVSALLQATPIPIVGRHRAASFSAQISPIELELGIPGLQDGIRMRRNEILDLLQEIEAMEHQISQLQPESGLADRIHVIQQETKAIDHRIKKQELESHRPDPPYSAAD